jgi:Replication factor C C-terminal domain
MATIFSFFLQRIPDHWLDGLLEKCRSGVYDIMEAYMSDFATEGYSATQLLYQLHERVVFSGELSDQQKSAIAEKMAVSSSAVKVIGVPVFHLACPRLQLCRILPFLDFPLSANLKGSMRVFERQHELRLFSWNASR